SFRGRIGSVPVLHHAEQGCGRVVHQQEVERGFLRFMNSSRLQLSLRAARFALIGLALLMPAVARAQSGIGDIVYTVGTVARDSHGQDWAYILWQATQPGVISNRVFAVYAKPGDATNPAPYVRLS